MIDRDEKGRAHLGGLEYLIQILIVLSLIAFALETLPNLEDSYRRYLKVFEYACLLIFTVEYGARVAFARPRKSYIFSFYGFIDLLAIIPFVLFLGLDFRAVRAFRLLRLFRVVKLARYSAAVLRFHRAFVIVKEELVLFGATALIVLFISAVGIYYFENPAQPEVFSSVFTSLWWAVCTLTTVGYGDIYPITVGGRLFTFIVLILGLGVIAVPTGLVASALAQARREELGTLEDELPLDQRSLIDPKSGEKSRL